MEQIVVLKGSQTKTHCSISSSIYPCEMLDARRERCLLYKKKLEYEFDAHAYKRCELCINNECKGE